MEALRQAMPGILEQVEADRAAAVAKERALQQERRHKALMTLTRGTSVQVLDNTGVDRLGVRILNRLIRGEYTTVGSVVDLLLVTSDERPEVEGIDTDDWLAIWCALLARGGVDETGKIAPSLLPDSSPPVHS